MTTRKSLMLLALLLMLGGCGIKPKELSPPEVKGAENPVFPGQYPDPKL